MGVIYNVAAAHTSYFYDKFDFNHSLAQQVSKEDLVKPLNEAWTHLTILSYRTGITNVLSSICFWTTVPINLGHFRHWLLLMGAVQNNVRSTMFTLAIKTKWISYHWGIITKQPWVISTGLVMVTSSSCSCLIAETPQLPVCVNWISLSFSQARNQVESNDHYSPNQWAVKIQRNASTSLLMSCKTSLSL